MSAREREVSERLPTEGQREASIGLRGVRVHLLERPNEVKGPQEACRVYSKKKERHERASERSARGQREALIGLRGAR